jgi:hypothetical protein
VQVRRDPAELVRGDAASASWTVDVEVLDRDGGLDFRRPTAQGNTAKVDRY